MGDIIAFFANIFGYILNFIYNIIGNYGWSIIIFCLFIKIVMIPLSIKQQKSMVKSAEMQEKMKEIQFKYKNNPEKLSQETMLLYKNGGTGSGCLTSIVQIILLISVFYLVRMPLTYMKNIDADVVDKYYKIMQENKMASSKSTYSEIEIIREVENIKKLKENVVSEEVKQEENNEEIQDNQIIETEQKEKKLEIIDEELDKMHINMEFLGLDLSQIPSNVIKVEKKDIGFMEIPIIKLNIKDIKELNVFIIPILYVIISFISMRITTQNQFKKQKEEVKIESNDKEKSLATTDDPMEAIDRANKSMSMIFPIMYISIALISPLGLALYWLVNSVLMIIERLILNKVIANKKEEEIC